MSKNFDMLQRINLNGGRAPLAQKTVPETFHAGNGNVQPSRLDLDRVTEEETLRLVQSIFLTNK